MPKMKLQELASKLTGLLATLSAIVSDRRSMAQQLLDAAIKAQADAEKIAALEATNTDLVASDAATDAEQAATIAAEYEDKVRTAEDALAAATADYEASTEMIATVVDSLSGLVGSEPSPETPAMPEVPVAPMPEPEPTVDPVVDPSVG